MRALRAKHQLASQTPRGSGLTALDSGNWLVTIENACDSAGATTIHSHYDTLSPVTVGISG
ncbi:hypothetical protein VD0002_g9496 [Verticillium dahliae]|uniref:Uncharacterized protein n=1 Tax=Verticillium dahliae TaxID=27337 RepID=A0AA44WGJ0_VERDA|nr:hypothetical protein BJF96_g5586 [Verticillium dahliae]PNH37163.1 hypothetical protein VD0004_g9617 [Verticillium dahliae]PNH42604.1 hypothetical protein VD0003_g9767 [Verticillium dahliae]PNH58027.1 hypothetical protein VD0002_g9496 [Verticillium dahliae]PNH66487.1 hypothetical protein VD0001_g8138 [Verticillium dahliae]